jgi:hypothetical protein
MRWKGIRQVAQGVGLNLVVVVVVEFPQCGYHPESYKAWKLEF